MRGLPEIVKTRQSGFKPSIVWMTANTEWTPGDVQYASDDVPELADLRPLVGCLVLVDGSQRETVERWCDALMAAGARTVAGTVYDKHARVQWTRNYRIEGVDL